MFNYITKKWTQRIAALLLLQFTHSLFFPSVSWALTSGPSSPDFSGFEPVSTTDMVNDLTGTFTYNLPVLSIPGGRWGGYAMSLSYHSDLSPEQEASWVGLGWTLNPGAINRSKRGFADDHKKVSVTKYNKTKPNWTHSSSPSLKIEFYSKPESEEASENNDGASSGSGQNGSSGSGQQQSSQNDAEDSSTENKLKTRFTNFFNFIAPTKAPNHGNYRGSFSFSKSIVYNNYMGYSLASGYGVDVAGMASLNMNTSATGATFGFSVNPLQIFAKKLEKLSNKLNKKIEDGVGKKKILAKTANRLKKLYKATGVEIKPTYSLPTYAGPSVPYSVAHNVGRSSNFHGSFEFQGAGPPIGLQLGINGNLNVQANVSEVHGKAFGYMYNPTKDNDYYVSQGTYFQQKQVSPDGTVLTLADYSIEKETSFNKHDKNLGIPFNNHDVFSVSGEGIAGGFRVHPTQIGHFYASPLKNEQKIFNVGVELGVINPVQIGFNIGIGKQSTAIDSWNNESYQSELSAFNFMNIETKKYLDKNIQFRFSNDPGGQVEYGNNDPTQIPSAKLDGSLLTGYGLSFGDLKGGSNYLNDTKFGGTQYIDYSVYGSSGQLDKKLDPSVELARIHEITDKYEGLIGQYSITHAAGDKSVFGLPVFTKNEVQLSVNTNETDHEKYITHQNLNINNPLTNKTAVGQKIAAPYASQYLLTSKLTANYIDVDNNGPTENDFGGWTKFKYRVAKFMDGNLDNWYRYRVPYTGMHFNRGRILDETDQTASMSSGDRQVYYMKEVETKTHVAFFVTNECQPSNYTDYLAGAGLSQDEIDRFNKNLTGSEEARLDAMGAAPIDGNMDVAATGVKGENKLERLEKIVLYAKNDLTKPLSVTYFEYDYSLCKNVANSASTNPNTSGKLTLKKVWSEAGGVTRHLIAPYEFDYEYFKNYPSHIMSKYTDIANDVNGYADLIENPTYEEESLDMWGNYQRNGKERFRKMKPWVSQEESGTQYDPAAWHLKRIKLPSGGEIHVQYEQKEYNKVQYKDPLAMVSLLPHADQENGYTPSEAIYYVNLKDLGIDITNHAEVEAYRQKLVNYFQERGNKLYFKVLYALQGGGDPDLNSWSKRRSDYVTGYTDVHGVATQAITGGYSILIKLGRNNRVNKKDKTLPRYICFKTLAGNGGYNLGEDDSQYLRDTDSDIHQNVSNIDFSNTSETDVKAALQSHVNRKYLMKNTFKLFGNWLTGNIKSADEDDACRVLTEEMSYFRLPTFHAKKGGGVRVKRLLSYDPGIAGESGSEMLYGSRYHYLNEDGTSSGVATFEPGKGREENPWVAPIGRWPQNFYDKMLNGEDSKRFEGPIGENVFPAPSVVHSRILVHNIHTGKSGAGIKVAEYHTCAEKEHALRAEWTKLKKGTSHLKYSRLNLPLGPINFSKNKAWATQGYRFVKSDMHGKPKSIGYYANVVNPSGTFDLINATTSTEWEYYADGNVPVLNYDNGSFKDVSGVKLGREEDLTLFVNSVTDKKKDFKVELDINFTSFPILYLGFGLGFSFTNNQYNQHVTSSVISQKSFVKSIKNKSAEGVKTITQNLAFDRNTGEPVVTKTIDGYESINLTDGTNSSDEHGNIYSLNIPASWMYPTMGQKQMSTSNLNYLTASAGNIVTYGPGGNPMDYLLAATPNYSTLPVVSATATVYSKDWYSGTLDNGDSRSDFIDNLYSSVNHHTEMNTRYMPLTSYYFKTDQLDGSATKAYDAGIANSFQFFNWANATSASNPNTSWDYASKVVAYSPHGNPIWEKDKLGINSVVQFGYNNLLPNAIITNAEYKSVVFKDFESETTISNNGIAHTGNKSLNYSANQNYLFVDQLKLNDQLNTNGAVVKFWLRSKKGTNSNAAGYGVIDVNVPTYLNINSQLHSCEMIAQAGEWMLYHAEIKDWNMPLDSDFNVSIQRDIIGNEAIYIDDFLFQPYNSSVSCIVYDTKDLKTIAQFDDQHFAQLFEYSEEGQLVRKQVETERGVKTIQEQFNNINRRNR